MTAKTRTELAGVFINGYIPQASDFGDVFDSFHNTTDDGTPATLGTNTFTGPQLFGGNRVEGFINKVVSGVSGTLTIADHSGNSLETAGNITVPTTPGFIATVRFGGAHTISFNSTVTAAFAAGDVATIQVFTPTVCVVGVLPVAAQVAFS